MKNGARFTFFRNKARVPELRRIRRRLHRQIARLQNEITILQAQLKVMERELLSPVAQSLDGDPTDETALGTPSFTRAVRSHRRFSKKGILSREGVSEPIKRLDNKLEAYKFAQSHQIDVPKRYGVWSHPEEICWDSLPEAFVLKRNYGGGAMGVYPLERTETGFLDLIAEEELTERDLIDRFMVKHGERSRYYAEELLEGIGKQTASGLPADIKIFSFYGEVGFLDLRTESWSRKKGGRYRSKTYLPDGTEVVDMRPLIPYGDDIQPPLDFTGLIEKCERLSRSIRRPYARLDFYEAPRGIVFGEVTPNSGLPPILSRDWDIFFGEKYENAYARLIMDLVDEGELQIRYGISPHKTSRAS